MHSRSTILRAAPLIAFVALMFSGCAKTEPAPSVTTTPEQQRADRKAADERLAADIAAAQKNGADKLAAEEEARKQNQATQLRLEEHKAAQEDEAAREKLVERINRVIADARNDFQKSDSVARFDRHLQPVPDTYEDLVLFLRAAYQSNHGLTSDEALDMAKRRDRYVYAWNKFYTVEDYGRMNQENRAWGLEQQRQAKQDAETRALFGKPAATTANN